MQEVAGHFVLNFLNQCVRSGLSEEDLWRGIRVPASELKRRGARLDWDDFAIFMGHWERALGPEEKWFEPARQFGRNDELRHLARLAGMFASPRLLYRLMCDWMGPSLASNLQFELEARPDDVFEVRMWVEPHYRPTRLFFVASVAVFETMPRHVGLPPAKVEILEASGHHALYRIFAPPSRTLASRARAVFGWVGGATSLVRVLRAQNDELRKSHAALERQHRDFHAILNNAAEGIAIVEADEVLYSNPALRRFIDGGGGEDVFRHGLLAHVDPADQPAWKLFWETWSATPAARLERQASEREFRFRTRSGEVRWLALSPPQRVQYAGREGWLLATRDVTELRALRTALSEAADAERQRIARDLHDGLGQILTGLSFKARVLQMSEQRDPSLAAQLAEELVELAQTAAVQARSLAHGLDLLVGSGDLATALRQFAADAARNLDLAITVEAPAATDITDRSVALEIIRIVQEAVHNAARHGDARRVQLQLERRDDRLVLSIEDDGRGMPPEGPPAEGMGLRVMRYRANRLGGRLTIGRAEAGGFRICGEFPIAATAPGHSAADAVVRRSPAAARAHLRRVFIADDHALVRAGMVELLAREANVQVVGETGEAAEIVEGVGSTRPDVVLIDLQMQGRDTLGIIRELRSRFPDLRIVVVSLFEAAIHGPAAAAAGADDYIAKSEAADRLRDAVGAPALAVGETLTRE